MKRKQNKSETEHRVPYASRRTAVVGEGGVSGRGNAEHKAASVVHAQPPGRAHLLCSYISFVALLVGEKEERKKPAKLLRVRVSRSRYRYLIVRILKRLFFDQVLSRVAARRREKREREAIVRWVSRDSRPRREDAVTVSAVKLSVIRRRIIIGQVRRTKKVWIISKFLWEKKISSACFRFPSLRDCVSWCMCAILAAKLSHLCTLNASLLHHVN